MNTQAIVVMALFLGGVWGGFITLLAIAMRRDRRPAGKNGHITE